MPESLEGYLAALKVALAGCDRALIQDALYDTRNRVHRELARLAWEDPLLLPDQALAKALGAIGPPEEAADTFRQRERVVAEAMESGPVRPDVSEQVRPWPSLMGIFADPKAYTSVLYLLLSCITGIFTFTWVVTGISLSLSLLVLIIGFPLLIFFLGSVRALGLAEGRLVEVLLDVRMPRRPSMVPEGHRWSERLGNLFKDGYTWTSLIYLLLRMPLGVLYFAFTIISFTLSFSFLLAPFAGILGTWCFDTESFGRMYGPHHLPPFGVLLGLGALGFMGLVGSLHAALALGRFQGWLARVFLVTR